MNDFSYIVESILKGNKTESLSEFLEKRAAGAKKVQQTAEAKGGLSILTSIHFKAKEIPYKNCLKHADDEDSSFTKKKADDCFNLLKEWEKMTQKQFQTVMGQLEAYGEAYIRSVETKGQ